LHQRLHQPSETAHETAAAALPTPSPRARAYNAIREQEIAHESAAPAPPNAPADADLAAVVQAWPNLPAAFRAGIVAMVRATVASE
jgi:hypothetical protein